MKICYSEDKEYQDIVLCSLNVFWADGIHPEYGLFFYGDWMTKLRTQHKHSYSLSVDSLPLCWTGVSNARM